MSYGVIPYWIDLNILSGIIGPEDDRKGSFDVMFGLLQPSLSGLDDEFEIEDGWLPANDILSLLLKGGTPQQSENCTKHWYVIERIIQVFGKSLNNRYWYPSDSVDVFYDYDEFKMYRVDQKGEIKIGFPDDFPVVFSVVRNDFSKALENIRNSNISNNQKKQFESWIMHAEDNNTDLILYYY